MTVTLTLAALLIEALTDNRNRTSAEVRHLLSQHGGTLGEPGSVAYLFAKRGLIVVDAGRYGEDDLVGAIDAGADAFLGTGVHVVRGIEIYKGRPIFYGLGEFFRQMDVIGLSGMSGRGRGDENSPPIKYESIVALSRYERGSLAEIRLHPIEITDQVRMAHRGIPRLASPQGAQRILARLQKLSAPFGTTITIENNIGVIRPRPATTAAGAN